MTQSIGDGIKDERESKIKAKHFGEWHKLFKYYSNFTGSHQNYQTIKQSDIHFKSKYMAKLKAYAIYRKIKNKKREIAEKVFFERKLTEIFNFWSQYFKNKKQIRRKQQKLI